MSTLNQLREGLSRAWDSLQEGWNYLRDRASHALTRFNPVRHGSQIETADEQVVRHASRWGLLPAEVIEHANEIVVRLEMPGMERDDFDISIVENMLIVRGEKRVQREQAGGRYYVLECAYGGFERAIPLPTAVDEPRVRASYKNGVLRVTLPKVALALAQAKRIPVTSA
jgi:HSP20 family protein